MLFLRPSEKSHEGKPGPRCLGLGAEGHGAGPVVALSCSEGCYILLSKVFQAYVPTPAAIPAPGGPQPPPGLQDIHLLAVQQAPSQVS